MEGAPHGFEWFHHLRTQIDRIATDFTVRIQCIDNLRDGDEIGNVDGSESWEVHGMRVREEYVN